MKRHFLFCLLALLVVSLAEAQTVVPLKKYAGNLKYIDVVVGGQSYKFLFDSGGGKTIISPAVAAALGKEPYGRSVSFRMSGEQVAFEHCDSVTLSLAGVNIPHPQLAVWDIMQVLPKELPPVDGLISLKTFEHLPVTVDLPNSRLILETAQSLRDKTRRMQLIPSRFSTGLDGAELGLFLGVPQNGKLWWFLFDSANLSDLLLSPVTAEAWGYAVKKSDAPQEIDSITFTPFADTPVQAAVENIIYDGALNYSVLSGRRFTISYPARKVWMSP